MLFKKKHFKDFNTSLTFSCLEISLIITQPLYLPLKSSSSTTRTRTNYNRLLKHGHLFTYFHYDCTQVILESLRALRDEFDIAARIYLFGSSVSLIDFHIAIIKITGPFPIYLLNTFLLSRCLTASFTSLFLRL